MSENQANTDTSGIENVANSLQDPSSGGDPKTVSDKPRRCLVISLIRHAQCVGNANRSWAGGDDHPDPLTEKGQHQAETLGKEWVDTNIDHLLSSPLLRAHDTATALSTHNKDHPKVVIDRLLRERRYGDKVYRLMQYDREAGARELRGCYYGLPSRDHAPAEGGESMNMVACRAERLINRILMKYAVDLSEAPEFFLEKTKTDSPAVLPDGIPHVVIVSHNVFLMELYEKMYSWGREHIETRCEWMNTEWSRHILWYDDDSDTLDVVDMKYCG